MPLFWKKRVVEPVVMSRSALAHKIEMALTGKVIARLALEQCELGVGSEYGVILQPLQMAVRSFKPSLSSIEGFPISVHDENIAQEILAALAMNQSVEVVGNGCAKTALLRSLVPQIEMKHGVVYVNQADAIEDVLQGIFEQLYQVPIDMKASRAEIRDGLSDRQALILLDNPTLTASEVDRLCRILPESLFVVASIERRFFQADRVIELSSQAISFASSQDMEKVLSNLINCASQSVVEERSLIITTVKWCVEQKRWVEAMQIVRSTEQVFATAKLWGAWEQLLNWGLQAAWALEDEVTEAWALHQLGTLAFCQEQVTFGYDLLKAALDLRSELGEETAIAFSQHNLSQLKALIVPMENESIL